MSIRMIVAYLNDPTATDANGTPMKNATLIAYDPKSGVTVSRNLEAIGPTAAWKNLPCVPTTYIRGEDSASRYELFPIDEQLERLCDICGGGETHADNCPEHPAVKRALRDDADSASSEELEAAGAIFDRLERGQDAAGPFLKLRPDDQRTLESDLAEDR